MKNLKKTLWIVAITLIISGCGGGGSSGDSSSSEDGNPSKTNTNINTNRDNDSEEKSPSNLKKPDGVGYYIDSAIKGVKFKCGSFSGDTDEKGTFFFEKNQNCIFSLNNLKLREVNTKKLYDGITIRENNLIIAQFLQSLDNDGNASNGINITQNTTNYLKKHLSQLPKNEDEIKQIISDLKQNIDSYNGYYVDQKTAKKHLDNKSPIIILNGSSKMTIAQGDVFIEPGIKVKDDYYSSSEITIIMPKASLVDTNTIGEYKLVYEAIDGAGNRALNTRIVNVVDKTKPIIIIPNTELFIELGSNFSKEDMLLNVTANDNVDGAIKVEVSSNVDTNTLGTYTLTYKATDSAGNIATTTRNVIVKDTTPPKFTLLSIKVRENQTTALTLKANDLSPVTYSINGGDADSFSIDKITGVISFKVAPDYEKKNSYTFKAKAVDKAGNFSEQDIVIEIIDIDEVPPIITLKGDIQMEVSQGDSFVDPGATANDNIDGAIKVEVSGNVDTNTLGTYTLTYKATDSAGNIATTTRSVIVKDTTPPIISLIGPNEITVFVGTTYIDPGAIAYDTRDGNFSSNEIDTFDDIDINSEGSYRVIYNLTDSDGNKAKEVIRTVKVINLTSRSTTQTKSYNTNNEEVLDGSLKDDGYYQKGVIPIYTYRENGRITIDYLTGIMWYDTNKTKRWLSLENYEICAGENGQTQDTSKCSDTSGDTARSFCADLVVDGYDDWRLPSMYEVISTKLPVGKQSFDNFKTWTSNSKMNNSNYEYYFDRGVLRISFKEKKEEYYLYCVRNSFDDSSIFKRDDNKKVVIDTKRNLMWQDDDAAAKTKKYWEAAISYCENLELAGYNDWRLPNIYEYMTTVDFNRTNPAMVSEFKSGYLGEYWTSTTSNDKVAFLESFNNNGVAVLFNTQYGLPFDDGSNASKDASNYVRCVRDNK